MTVIGLQDFISASLARQVKPATLRASAATPLPPVTTNNAAPAENEAALSSSIPTQSLNTASFNTASVSVAQFSSVLQVAQGGIDDIQSLLQQLHNLAGQPAAGTDVSTATLARINSAFQQILSQINRIAIGTTFNGASVLDGTFTSQQLTALATNTQSSSSISLPDLTTKALFNGSQPTLLTPEAAAQAYSGVTTAKGKVDKAGNDIKDIKNQLEFASASLQTALSNIDASTAVISDSDLEGVFENLLGGLIDQPVAAAQLQASNISPNLLSLIQD